jgi:hypothetical protein
LIITGATLVARRWGENIGGLLIGLPLTSAPVSVFFALEQGRQFASGAAEGAMLGLIPVVVFCLGYTFAANSTPARKTTHLGAVGRSGSGGYPWTLSALIAISLYLISVWAMSRVAPPLGWVVILVATVLATGKHVLGKGETGAITREAPVWDLPLRVSIATLLILGITGGARALGPKWGGLLSPFPVFTFVMAAFSHRQGGPEAALRLMRGVLSGLFAYLAFFLVVALLVEGQDLLLVYTLAACAALGVNGLSLALLIWRKNDN